MNDDLAKIFLKMTWREMDEFAEMIIDISTDDAGTANDAAYIANSLVVISDEVTQ